MIILKLPTVVQYEILNELVYSFPYTPDNQPIVIAFDRNQRTENNPVVQAICRHKHSDAKTKPDWLLHSFI